MLPPVAAISSLGAVAPQREAATVAEALSTMTAEPDGTIALSLAVSAGVEGKLNMLLINAREQMINSLFDVIDALSQSLALQQEPDESNASYALRLADTITELPARQTAAVQQQLATQGQSAPLSLIAAALHDPTSPQAAQLVAYLEVVRYKDKDLATRSVVASYGQNDGNAGPETASDATPARSAAAQAATTPNPAALPQGQSTAQAAAAGTLAAVEVVEPLPEETEAPQAMTDAEATPETVEQTVPQPAANATAASVANPLAGTRSGTAAAQAAETSAAAILAEAVATTAEEPATPTDETMPRVIVQIRSDIKEGLKAVFDRLVEATGTELLQTMAEAEPLADKVIAQALIADMIDGTELQELPTPENQTPAQKAAAASSQPVATMVSEAVAEETAAPATTASQQPAAAQVAAEQAARPQATTPPGFVIGYVTTPYAPAEDVIEDRDPMRIDRVDAVDDDEHEEPGKQQHQQQAQSEDEPETPAEEALDMLAGEPDAPAAATEAPVQGRSTLLALPQPAAAEMMPNPGYNLYERMGA